MNAPPGPYGPPAGSYPQQNPYAPHPMQPQVHQPQQPTPYGVYGGNPYAQNPYAPPGYQSPPVYGGFGGVAPEAALTTRLYTPGHVSLATFLGTPLAGSILMALNENRLGKQGVAIKTMLVGIFATIVLIGVSFALPENFPAFPINIATLLFMGWIARSRQGAAVARHVAAGGRPASGWAAAGIGLLCLLLVFVPLFVIFVGIEVLKGQ